MLTHAKQPVIGVLGMQGDVHAHQRALEAAGARSVIVRQADELGQVDGLVLPGGESTTIGMLLERFGLLEPLRRRVAEGLPVFGTCAGVILLAEDIAGSPQPRIGGLDVTVVRNAYGRQVDSFECELTVPSLGSAPLRGVFIRAPQIHRVGPAVEVLAQTDAGPVLVQQGSLLGATFHPELTADCRVHAAFLALVRDS